MCAMENGLEVYKRHCDTEYERSGVSNFFLKPLWDWRKIQVTIQITKIDWAQAAKKLADHESPEAGKRVLILEKQIETALAGNASHAQAWELIEQVQIEVLARI